jgi:hypothetical protein
MTKWWICVIAVWCCQSRADEVDIQALVKETQISRQAAGKLDLVWWIPTEFWSESFRRNAAMPALQRDEMIATIDEYVIVAAIESNIGTLGTMSSTSKEDMEKEAKLVVGKVQLSPIPESELTAGARNFVQIMKPVIANMLGQVGQGLHFIAFKGKNEKGEAVVNPKLPGQLSFKLGEKSFDYRLPLGSLLPAKMDADSGDRFPGNFNYNPYTGKKLVGAK